MVVDFDFVINILERQYDDPTGGLQHSLANQTTIAVVFFGGCF